MTTPPNTLTATINHERSPVLLTEEEQSSTWLTASPKEAFGLIRTVDHRGPAANGLPALGGCTARPLPRKRKGPGLRGTTAPWCGDKAGFQENGCLGNLFHTHRGHMKGCRVWPPRSIFSRSDEATLTHRRLANLFDLRMSDGAWETFRPTRAASMKLGTNCSCGELAQHRA
jgi:hypothetical protein